MKHLISLLLLISCAVGINAEVLTPQQAISRIPDGKSRRVKPNGHLKLAQTVYSTDGKPAVYVFTGEDNRGFVAVSADDLATPVLGYSDENVWDSSNLPAQMEGWLDEYANQISYIRQNPAAAVSKRAGDTRAAEEWDPISPMVKTAWDQDYPYNMLCPLEGNRRTYTGCVATAMAQIMNYWKYPEVGTGAITYVPGDGNLGELSLNFSLQPFDWANMKDTYRTYTMVQANAVAYLMKACGYSLKMNYTSNSSGALSTDIAPALRNYFSYDRGIEYKERSGISDAEWEKFIYDQLKYCGPLMYDGVANVASRSGHSFICDGYDKDRYFHINWGWNGMCDGYYLLSALNPSSLGSGGGDTSGYNYFQGIVYGITPPMGRISIPSITIGNASPESGNVSGKGYIYRIDDPANIQISMTVDVSGGPVSTPIEISIFETDPTTMRNVGKVYEEMFPEKLNAAAGERVNFSHSFNFKTFDPSKLYTMNVYYTLKGQKEAINMLRMAASSGIGEILAEGNKHIEVFDISGRKVATISGDNPSLPADRLGKGIYVVRTIDASGKVTTRKITI